MKTSIKFALISVGLILGLILLDIIGQFAAYGLLFLALIIFMIIYKNEQEKAKREKRKKLNDELSNINGFSPTKRMVGDWGLIAIDENSKQIAIKENKGAVKLYDFSDIYSCEVIEDGKITYRKSTSRTIGGVVIGGAIAGIPGALIGGLTGKTKSQKKISNIDFNIILKGTTFKIRFFDAAEESLGTLKEIKVDDNTYGRKIERAITKVKEWQAVIENIIENSDK